MKTLISIPGADVVLTDARRKVSRTVTLASFEMGETPVSATQFDAGHLGQTDSDLEEYPARGVRWIDAVQWCNTASAHDGYDPVYHLDGREFRWDLAADGYRLPTEAEWVHASRSGSLAARYGDLEQIAWTALDGVHGPQPMGRKTPNVYGLYDTLGNVWEWCWDRLDPARYGDYRLLKGGGWADPSWSVRVGVRRGNAPDARLEDAGFRVARGAASHYQNVDGGQGWSERSDRERASIQGALPVGWTPLGREKSG